MSDDLVKRLRDMNGGWASDEALAAAARIEELEAKALANKVAIMRLEAENARMREALTPSGDTKAAYISEIECDCPTENWRHYVPWISIKEIMKMIRARAALQDTATDTAPKTEGNDASQ